MKSTRFLLPFTQGIDLGVLEYAVQFARSCQATLIPLALIPLSGQQWAKGPRLEAIEQANDFLEAVKYKAERAGVVVEPCEMGTRDVVRSLNVFAQEMMCEGILLFLRDGTTVLLPPEVVKRLLEQATCRLCLVRLQPKDRTGPVQTLLKRCSDCIRRWRGHQVQSALVCAIIRSRRARYQLARPDGLGHATRCEKPGASPSRGRQTACRRAVRCTRQSRETSGISSTGQSAETLSA